MHTYWSDTHTHTHTHTGVCTLGRATSKAGKLLAFFELQLAYFPPATMNDESVRAYNRCQKHRNASHLPLTVLPRQNMGMKRTKGSHTYSNNGLVGAKDNLQADRSVMLHVQVWPELYIYGVYTVILTGKSPNIRSYTVYIYGSGQPYACVLFLLPAFSADHCQLPPPRRGENRAGEVHDYWRKQVVHGACMIVYVRVLHTNLSLPSLHILSTYLSNRL